MLTRGRLRKKIETLRGAETWASVARIYTILNYQQLKAFKLMFESHDEQSIDDEMMWCSDIREYNLLGASHTRARK